MQAGIERRLVAGKESLVDLGITDQIYPVDGPTGLTEDIVPQAFAYRDDTICLAVEPVFNSAAEIRKKEILPALERERKALTKHGACTMPVS